jgi:hypothetical protein
MIQDNCHMWRHIFNINIAVIFEFFFKNFFFLKDIGNYRTEEDDQSYRLCPVTNLLVFKTKN